MSNRNERRAYRLLLQAAQRAVEERKFCALVLAELMTYIDEDGGELSSPTMQKALAEYRGSRSRCADVEALVNAAEEALDA